VSRGIQLLEKKKSDLVWYLFKKTIFNLFLELLPDLDDISIDDEGVLKEFVI